MSTSTERTYRYVRLGILAAVLALAVSVAAVLAGGGLLASISAVHYTAGSGVFTGALFAICLAFLALAGRSPSQALLDLAALVAPLIAIMPTPVGTGDAPGVTVSCDLPCVPDAELPSIENGLVTYLVVAAVLIALALVLGVVQRTLGRGLIATAAIAAASLAAGAAWWLIDRPAFVLNAHVVAATAFFALVAAVSALAAWHSAPPFRAVYLTVSMAIAVDLVALVAVVVLRFTGIDVARDTGLPLVLYGEVAALALFAVFWVAQTVQYWNDVDPALRAVTPLPSPSHRAG